MTLSKLPYRLTIGVTGHRTLNDLAALTAAIESVYEDISNRISIEPGIEIKYALLSPLAEGADRLVAHVLLDKAPDTILKAILPFNKYDYIKDFKSDESKEEFEGLLQKAQSIVSMRTTSLEKDYPVEQLAEARKLGYRDAGRFVVEHCDLLIALWDRRPPRGVGGTAEVVAYAMDTRCPIYIIDTANPAFFEKPVNIPMPKNSIEKLLSFNDEIGRWSDKTGYVDEVFKDLFLSPDTGKIPDFIKQAIREHLIPYYVIASKQAKRAQFFYKNISLYAFVLALVAAGVVAFGTVFIPDVHHHLPPLPIFIIEVVILVFISLMILLADWRKVHKKWMGARFLTERVRSALFMAACQVETGPLFVKRRQLQKKSVHDWVLFAFEEIWTQLPKQKDISRECAALGEFVRLQWIMDQRAYHEKNAIKRLRIHEQLEQWGEGLFIAAIVCAGIHIVSAYWHPFEGILSSTAILLIERVLTWLSLTLPAVAATLEGIRSHREDRRIAQQSEKMLGQIDELDKAFQLVNDRNIDHLLMRTEQIMLDEIRDWVSFVSVAKLTKVI